MAKASYKRYGCKDLNFLGPICMSIKYLMDHHTLLSLVGVTNDPVDTLRDDAWFDASPSCRLLLLISQVQRVEPTAQIHSTAQWSVSTEPFIRGHENNILPLTLSSVYIASSITILKTIHAGVGFGSGTEDESHSSVIHCLMRGYSSH